jgi:hypothetical protein
MIGYLSFIAVLVSVHDVCGLPSDILKSSASLGNLKQHHIIQTLSLSGNPWTLIARNRFSIGVGTLRGGGFGSRKKEIDVKKKEEPPMVDIHRLPPKVIIDYIGKLLVDQLWAVLPICVFLAGIQLTILRQGIAGAGGILSGLVLVVLGLALFNFGLLYGLMPTGRELGLRLPSVLPLDRLLIVAGVLGVAVTLAEPALGIVKTAGELIDEEQAPYLYALLHRQQVFHADNHTRLFRGCAGA